MSSAYRDIWCGRIVKLQRSLCTVLVLSALFASVITAAGAASPASAAAVSGDSEADRAPLSRQEARLAKETSKAIEDHFHIVYDPAVKTRLDIIVSRLRPYLSRKLDYDIKVIDHEMINAFAIAGGQMYVSTGMLDFVKSDLELAGVIAHEMVHADRGHVVKQMERYNSVSLITLAAAVAAIAGGAGGAPIFLANTLQAAVMGHYSIEMEREADAFGIDVMVSAGYEPSGMLTLQERLKIEAMRHPQVDLGVYNTHPEHDERTAAAEKYMKEHGILPNRKLSLGLLRTSIRRSGEAHSRAESLFIDDVEIVRVASTDRASAAVRAFADKLDASLRLETPPFDIRVDHGVGGRAFYIGSKNVLSAADVPSLCIIEEKMDKVGEEELDIIRSRVLDALNAARRQHPLADLYSCMMMVPNNG